MTSHWRCANGHTYTSPAPQTVCAYGRCGAPVECTRGPLKRKGEKG